MEFARACMGFQPGRPVPKSVKQYIYRCRKLFETQWLDHRGVHARMKRNGPRATRATRKTGRRRRLGMQGAPHLLPELRNALFQWFIDIRKSVKGRLWARQVLQQARCLRGEIQTEAHKMGLPPPRSPKLHYRWLQLWKDQYGVSLRKPNRKFKVSHRKMKSRTKYAWLNVWRARCIYRLCYGAMRRAKGLKDDMPIHIVDQKGVHYNEAESKNAPTLDFVGATVDLKTNHAQSRLRMSLNTHASNDPYFQPPIECCFAAKTARTFKNLRTPDDVHMSLRHAPKGSYRDPRWKPEAGDRRLLYQYSIIACMGWRFRTVYNTIPTF